jgi:hypothetical protein
MQGLHGVEGGLDEVFLADEVIQGQEHSSLQDDLHSFPSGDCAQVVEVDSHLCPYIRVFKGGEGDVPVQDTDGDCQIGRARACSDIGESGHGVVGDRPADYAPLLGDANWEVLEGVYLAELWEE